MAVKPDVRSRKYWNKRVLTDKAKIINNAEKFLLDNQRRLYGQAEKEIQDEINKLYEKFAKTQQVSLAEARQLIRGADFRKINWDEMIQQSLELRKKIREGKDVLPEEIIQRLEAQHKKLEDQIAALSKRGQVSYLELRQIEIDRKLLSLYDQQQMNIYDYLQSEYEDGYYRQVYNTQQMQGFGYDFVHPNEAAIDKAILNQYQAQNFSATLYKHCDNFSKDLRDNLVVGLIRGESLDKMASRIRKRMGVAYSAAKRLVRTETAYVYEQATKDAYEQCDIEYYEFLATLDYKTSEICRELDGKHFKVKDALPGKNYPPMHPNCRSTTVCWFPDEKAKKRKTTRLAKDNNGDYYEVPADMTYKQWQKKYGADAKEDIGRSVKMFMDEVTDLKEPVKLDKVQYGKEIRKMVEVNHSAAAGKILQYYDQIQFINLDPKYKAVFYSSPRKTGIRINMEKARNSKRGKFSTLWHEIGHNVDHLEGYKLHGDQFRSALEGDVNKVFKTLIDNGLCSNMEESYQYVDRRMRKEPQTYAVADIMKTVTKGKVGTGHDLSYMEKDADNLNSEAYALFFEAQMLQGKSLEYIRQMLPAAYQMFEEALNDGR